MTDFSGEWELLPKESSFGFLPPPVSRLDRVAQTGDDLLVATRQVDDNGDNTVERHLKVDGPPTQIQVLGRDRSISSRWDGTDLVVETRFEVSGRSRLIEDRWSLSTDRERLSIRRRVEQTGGAVRQMLLFSRRHD